MRIGIDVRLLEDTKAMTGIGVYLYENLIALNEIDNINEYYLFSRKPIDMSSFNSYRWHNIVKDFPIGILWFDFILPILLGKLEIQVFWSVNHFLPLIKGRNCKYILTIHDIAILKIKGIGEYNNIIKQFMLVKRSCNKANVIIADSIATKNDLSKVLNISEEKIKVIYLGSTRTNVRSDSRVDTSTRLKRVSNDYIFYFGTLEPRKNVITLVKAFEKVKGEFPELQLVIAGGRGWRFEATQEYINNSKDKESIVQLGYISEEEKRLLLKKCCCFAFPSLYEGFGIPVLEALSIGAVVVTSHVSSLPEVGGDCAIYIDYPTNENALASSLKKVLNLSDEERMKLTENGQKWARNFTWKHCANEIYKVIMSFGDQNCYEDNDR